MKVAQLLLPVEEIADEFPQCDALWHLGPIPSRCVLPVQHPRAKRTDGFWVMGHFYTQGSFQDWAEVCPWNAAWADVHLAFYYGERRKLETEFVTACVEDWSGGPPAPTRIDHDLLEERVLARIHTVNGYGRGLPRWNW